MRKLSRSLRERSGAWESAARECGVGLQRRDGVIAWRRAARVGSTRVRTVGKVTLGEKNIMFLAETLSKLRFLVLHSPSILSTSKKNI
jgi:hypothetical protein